MKKEQKHKSDLLWYVRLQVCNSYGVLREIYWDELDDASQERVMASIQDEVAQGSVGFRLDGIAVDDVTLDEE